MCVCWGDSGRWKSLVDQGWTIIEAPFLKISVHIIEHLFKLPEPVSLPQEVAFEDKKDLIRLRAACVESQT